MITLAMFKTFQYKLQPNRSQRASLDRTLEVCRELYNIALEQRHYQRLGWMQQSRQLTVLRHSCPEYAAVYGHILQNVLKKLDHSFSDFVGRVKRGERPGFPRFRGRGRYDSFTYNNKGHSVVGKYVHLSKIGNIKAHISRPLTGTVKTCTLKRKCGAWYVFVVCEVEPRPLPVSSARIGIDVGIKNLLALSNGQVIANPRWYQRRQPQLRRAQRQVARKLRGSRRYTQSLLAVQKLHRQLADRRRDYLHKHSTALVREFGVIAIERLRIGNLVRGLLGKQIHDVGWAMFFDMLRYKAEDAGRQVVEVECAYTSQSCPQCGHREAKPLSLREHRCSTCGCTEDRDIAAAKVIVGRAAPSLANVERVCAQA